MVPKKDIESGVYQVAQVQMASQAQPSPVTMVPAPMIDWGAMYDSVQVDKLVAISVVAAHLHLVSYW